jgi:N-acetylneuraminic acid mutarotase
MNVLEFDLSTNEFKAMPPLPCGLSYMAGVHWGDQAILIGGSDDNNGQSKKVFMYNSKTGNTTELPSMLEERAGCSAIITGNTIVVMGGRGKTTGRVRSVEAFTLGGYTIHHNIIITCKKSYMFRQIIITRNTLAL